MALLIIIVELIIILLLVLAVIITRAMIQEKNETIKAKDIIIKDLLNPK